MDIAPPAQALTPEFKRNLQSDVRRLFQLTKSTSSPTHPFHKFSTGNLQTLSGAAAFMPPHAAARRRPCTASRHPPRP